MSPDTKVDALTDGLRERVKRGDFGTAGRLPSLRMLATEYDTTNETMNKVVQRLQAEGILISLGRQGVFVHPPITPVPGITRRFDELLAQMHLTPVETNIETPSYVPAPPEVARVFDILPGSKIMRRWRRQGTSMLHYRLAENYYAPNLVDDEVLTHIQEDEHYDVLAHIRERHQVVITQVHEQVSARLPTSQEQELLNIVRHTPLLEVMRSSYSGDNGIVIMYSHIIFVASFSYLEYDYHVNFW